MNKRAMTIVLLFSVLISIEAAAKEPVAEEAGCASLEACVEAKRAEFQTRGTVGILIHPLAVSAEGHGRWRVKQVMPGGPAKVAGLEPEDVLLAWNGKPLPTSNETGMTTILRAIEIGEQIEIGVARGEKHPTLTLIAVGPSRDAVEYWLLLFVQENYTEEEFLAYQAAVEQRLVHPNDP